MIAVHKIRLRRSKRGVPHTVFETSVGSFSVCYFGKTNTYRIFNWETQERILDVALEKQDEFDFMQVLKQLDEELQRQSQDTEK